VKVGQHELEIEEPDFVVLRLGGEILPADAEVFGRAFLAQARGGRIFVMSVVERGTVKMSGEARKTFIKTTRGMSHVFDAVVGADFSTRVLGGLVGTAARVLGGFQMQFGFFDDEPSARAWLREQGCVASGAPPRPDRNQP
jgi:hypothetical protein